jgi:hypothetical protein
VEHGLQKKIENETDDDLVERPLEFENVEIPPGVLATPPNF